MKKRGEVTLWFLMELAASVLIVFIAVTVALAYAKGTTYEQLNIARNIAMQINTLSSLPGEAYIVNNPHGYSIKISDNKVEVFEAKFDLFSQSHYFVKIGDTNFDLILEKPEQVVIAKIDNKIMISEEIPDLS